MEDSQNKYCSINDLTAFERELYVSKYIENHSKIIRKYFSLLERSFCKKSFLSWIFHSNPEINTARLTMTETEYRFSSNKITVPYEFHITSDILLRSDLDRKGIFRVNGVSRNIVSFLETIRSMSDGRIDETVGRSMIESTFDLIDVAESYKLLFKKLEKAVVPEDMYTMAEKIQAIEDSEEKKVCTKIFLFSIPTVNMMILENCVFLCTEISNRLENTQEKEKMNLRGLSVVMMPNLMRLRAERIDNMKVKELSDFMVYVFENFKEFIKV